ncbi:cupin domain-containing protein [Pseudomonas anuradhapurensis]
MRTALLLLTAWFIAGCGNTPAHADAIEAKTLLRTQVAWDQTPYTTYPSGRPELSLMKIRIPARTTMDWHCHLAPNAGYLLAGQIEVENAAGIRVMLNAGDALAEIVGGLHRGRTAEAPAEILVFYASATGIAPFTPAEQCPQRVPKQGMATPAAG